MTDPAETIDPDGALLERIAAGDLQAVGDLYDRYAGLLYGLVLHILHDETDAEHVLQDVFLHVREQAPSYRRHLGMPPAWLVALARQRAVDRLRSRPTYPRAAEADAQAPQQRGSRVGRSQQQQAAAVALASLPAEQRQLIEQAFFLGFSQAELATRHRLPLAIVFARIRTGMLVLREQLHYFSWAEER